jgi:hypothetical protein
MVDFGRKSARDVGGADGGRSDKRSGAMPKYIVVRTTHETDFQNEISKNAGNGYVLHSFQLVEIGGIHYVGIIVLDPQLHARLGNR